MFGEQNACNLSNTYPCVLQGFVSCFHNSYIDNEPVYSNGYNGRKYFTFCADVATHKTETMYPYKRTYQTPDIIVWATIYKHVYGQNET